MNKKYFFLAGIPRSGSTLLGALLSQNKIIHVSGTSGVLGILTNIRNSWSLAAEIKAMGEPLSSVRKLAVMRGVMDGFYDDIDRPIIIDKCRTWPAQLELAEALIGEKPKIIVTVRDVRDVLASFEKLWRARKAANLPIDQEKLTPNEYLSIEGRCRVLMAQNGVVGGAATMICDAVVRGWRSQMLFVEYEDLCARPADVLRRIYGFLGLLPMEHNFINVQANVAEDDEVYGWGDLHSVLPQVRPRTPSWDKIIPEHVALQYASEAHFWRTLPG